MQFQQRHAETINAQVSEVEERAEQYRIAHKVYRIGEHQELYDTSKASIAEAETTQDKLAAVKTALQALHSVAEELGQLPRPDQNINIKAMLLLREVGGTDVEVS
jgi:hypothetical protein